MATKKEPLTEGLGINVECLIQVVPWDLGVHVLLHAPPRYPGDHHYKATNVSFEPWDVATEAADYTFKLRHDSPQKLMDELWKAGIRPSSGEGSVGQLAATEYHLKDMRAIVQKYLKTDLP
jgi:hypothetical protein